MRSLCLGRRGFTRCPENSKVVCFAQLLEIKTPKPPTEVHEINLKSFKKMKKKSRERKKARNFGPYPDRPPPGLPHPRPPPLGPAPPRTAPHQDRLHPGPPPVWWSAGSRHAGIEQSHHKGNVHSAFIKPTNLGVPLQDTSCHPAHIHKSWPVSMVRRLGDLSTSHSYAEKAKDILIERFVKHLASPNLIDRLRATSTRQTRTSSRAQHHSGKRMWVHLSISPSLVCTRYKSSRTILERRKLERHPISRIRRGSRK